MHSESKFEGASQQTVKEANQRAQIPFQRIYEAEFITLEDPS